MTKILYSPGFGAGWSTWAHNDDPEFQRFILTYPPIIDALERGEKLIPDEHRWDGPEEMLPYVHPVLRQFLADLKERFGETYFYLGGADDLCIAEVHGPFRIDEYDGSESIVEKSDQEWIKL